MNKQIDINDMIPTETMISVRDFMERKSKYKSVNGELLPIRTRYEAYGVMHERFMRVCADMDSVKADMKIMGTALTYTDQSFNDVVEQTYSGLVELAAAAIDMGANALNVILEISDMIAGTPTPLEEMAAQENIDDEDSKKNEEEEF